MHCFSLTNMLLLLALSASLLVAGCGADAAPTPTPAPHPTPTPCLCSSHHCYSEDVDPCTRVDLERNHFAVDLPISTTAVLAFFEPGELIEVTLTASDGSALVMGIATANEGWMAAVDIEHDGLPEGVYVIEAASETGGRATTPLFVK